MSTAFDIVVVGAGPGGMAAAALAAEAGCRVCLLDDNRSPGGQIWRGFRSPEAAGYPHGKAFIRWRNRLERSGCEVWQGWRAIGRPNSSSLRLDRDGEQSDIAFQKLILATGARERFLPFPGWTLPGVMGAGGLQALVKSGLDPRGKRVLVAGSGPLLLAVAAGLSKAGAQVLGVHEQAPLARLAAFSVTLLGHPGKLLEGARYRMKTLGAPYRTGSWVVKAEGRGRVERVRLTDGKKQWTEECDWLACGFHLVPNLELPALFDCRIVAGFVQVDRLQQSSVPGIACIGELTGLGGLDKALVEGQIAGLAASGHEIEALSLAPAARRLQGFVRSLDRAFALRPELKDMPLADTVVCRCEDVPHSELEPCTNWRQAKLHTRCGMGACQGRVCGAATQFLFGWESTSGRPPVFPAAASTLAAAPGAADSGDR